MKTLTLYILILSSSLSLAIDFKLESTSQQTEVIELFTSEGCSSCPPADRWLSSLKHHVGLWNDFIPLAFHVDYWDYIGWKDKFSLPIASKRQRQHHKLKNIGTVYTPGVLKAGQEWRSWRNRIIPKNNRDVGILSLEINDNKLTARFENQKLSQDLRLTIALLGMNLTSKISAGENHGKTLYHDFVPLKFQTFDSKDQSWNVQIDSAFFSSKYTDLAFVAWIESQSNPAPIQAIGAPLSMLENLTDQ